MRGVVTSARFYVNDRNACFACTIGSVEVVKDEFGSPLKGAFGIFICHDEVITSEM